VPSLYADNMQWASMCRKDDFNTAMYCTIVRLAFQNVGRHDDREDQLVALKAHVVFAGLKFLCFRQNLISDASSIATAESRHCLEELYINDNQLKDIPELSGFARLKRLEFSYNHEV
jgi:hypothetical protein